MTMRDALLRLRRWVIANALAAGLLFGVSGRLDLPMLWAYWGVFGTLTFLAIFLVFDPALWKERLRQRSGGHDPVWLAVIRILGVGHLVVALLDVGRFHWSDTVPLNVQVTGLILLAASATWVGWAIATNRFFVPVMRIQAERGHQVVAGGPYEYVRHPGYAGMIFYIPCSALALGSWWALAPAIAYSLVILRRAAREDRFLKDQLAGYGAYTERVQYRLIPGVW